MDMKSNTLDVVIGPIETYEDRLLGAKASNEAFVLVKDREWSERLSRYAALLPDLQEGLPVADEYKQETPAGTDSDLNAYDVVYNAGDCNAGSKTIAINLPNDEEVRRRKGTRRLQLKNSIRAKFDKILEPLAGVLIAPDQRSHVTFDAFFGKTMFHEVAHGLGINTTITGRGTVREALREHASALSRRARPTSSACTWSPRSPSRASSATSTFSTATPPSWPASSARSASAPPPPTAGPT